MSPKLKLTNPKHITDAFRKYYAYCYNLRVDLNALQPTIDQINFFFST